jgi:hypothetical protein
MTHSSPTMEGFRAAFREPEIALAELTWRWAFGAAAVFLLLFSFFEYLHTVPVTFGDALFLRSRQPFLISQALAHMFAGSAQRFVMTRLIVLPALAIAWIAAASAGRLATAGRLLEHFRIERIVGADEMASRPKQGVKSLFGLNFLRAALALATIVGLGAASILSGFVSSDADPQPGLAFFVFVCLVILIASLWLAVNWFLSLAPLFVLDEGRDTFGAISGAVDFCRTRASAVAWSSTVFGLAHFVAFVLATAAAFVPLMLIGSVPKGIVFLGVFFVTLTYFAVVDFLYVGRLASYVAILVRPENEPAAASIQPLPTDQTPALAGAGSGTAVDQNETILSDVPLPLASSEDGDISRGFPGSPLRPGTPRSHDFPDE